MAYNGWKNYETWNVALWMDNEQGTYSERVDAGQSAWDKTDERMTLREDRSDEARRTFATWIEDFVMENLVPDLGASMAADILGAAMGEVDWDEIANNWLNDIDDYVDDVPAWAAK